MSARTHAARTIAKRQVFETLIGPGFYVALAAGLLLGYFLVRGFVSAVDSSGFNYQLNPLYDLVGRALEGAFGKTFLDKVFAEGPFLFSVIVAFAPVFLFLAVSSVFRFGLEKTAGAIELLTYGPADGTSYLLASFARDLILSAVSLVVLLAFMAVAAALNNLVLGPAFLLSLPLIFLLSLAVSAYGTFASTITANAVSALALFIGIMVVFLLILAGSFALVGGYVRSLASVSSWLLGWISPLFYAKLCLQAMEAGRLLLFAGSLALLAALTAILLYCSHLVITARGVRA